MKTIVHDNGIEGQKGATEYSEYEIESLGGIETLLESYKNSGITVYSVL